MPSAVFAELHWRTRPFSITNMSMDGIWTGMRRSNGFMSNARTESATMNGRCGNLAFQDHELKQEADQFGFLLQFILEIKKAERRRRCDMGVDAVIELNPRTQIQDVAMVLTRLCGLKPYVIKDNGKEFVYVSKKIKITNSSVVGLANVSCNSMGVELKNRKGELKEGFSFCYHFQPTSGYKLMMPPSTGF
jgi:hypothetical protein